MSKPPNNFKSKSIMVSRISFIAVVVMLVTTSLLAQSTSTYTEYAAKFICGNTSGGGAIATADYYTTINPQSQSLHHRPTALLSQESGLGAP